MGRTAAFLRGINLGRRRVTGEQLAAPFAALGLADVRTFLASGNVVFTADDGEDERDLAARIEASLQDALGYQVTTFLRSESELAAIVDRTPFPAPALERSTGKPQVILLREEPTSEQAAAALAHASDDDLLALCGRELHWLPAGSMSTSALDVDALARSLGPFTIRTANTLARLRAKYFAG